eukprot:m.87099 g.87099  ORF g.87099 m.87099 type:complete len:258 (+) comp14492_c1_seq2:897-1670(+)
MVVSAKGPNQKSNLSCFDHMRSLTVWRLTPFYLDLPLLLPPGRHFFFLSRWDDPGLRSGVYIDGVLNDPNAVDYYWTVEIAFPLKALAYNTTANVPPRPGEYWRINFSRVEWHVVKNGSHFSKVPNVPEDNWVLAPTYVVDIHLPEYWAYLQFADTNVNGTAPVTDPNWTIRFVAMQLYYAELAYQQANGKYTDSLEDIAPLTPVEGVLSHGCVGNIAIDLGGQGQNYTATVADVENKNMAVIRDDRYLFVTQVSAL